MKFVYTCSKCGHVSNVDCMFEPKDEHNYWDCIKCGAIIRKVDTE